MTSKPEIGSICAVDPSIWSPLWNAYADPANSHYGEVVEVQNHSSIGGIKVPQIYARSLITSHHGQYIDIAQLVLLAC